MKKVKDYQKKVKGMDHNDLTLFLKGEKVTEQFFWFYKRMKKTVTFLYGESVCYDLEHETMSYASYLTLKKMGFNFDFKNWFCGFDGKVLDEERVLKYEELLRKMLNVDCDFEFDGEEEHLLPLVSFVLTVFLLRKFVCDVKMSFGEELDKSNLDNLDVFYTVC